MSETTERPFNVALSHEEINALVKYHTSCIRRVSNRAGQIMLKPGSLIASAREMRLLAEKGKEIVTLHAARARELLALLKKGAQR